MLIFASSIGRSGTRYLSELAGSMLPFSCHHLAEPFCHDKVYESVNQGGNPGEISEKWEAVSAEAERNGGHYFESTPVFVRGLADFFLDRTDDIGVIQLLRDPLSVAKSYTNRDSYPSHPSRPWRLPLNTAKTTLRVPGDLHPFQENLVDWLENELRFQALRDRITSVEVLTFADLQQGERLRKILENWGLPVDRGAVNEESLDRNANKIETRVGEEECHLADDLIARLGKIDFDRTVFERAEYQAFAFLRRLVDPSC